MADMERNVKKKWKDWILWRGKSVRFVFVLVRDSGIAIMGLNDEVLCENWKTKRIIVNCGRDCKLELPMQIRMQQIGCVCRFSVPLLAYALRVFSSVSWQ